MGNTDGAWSTTTNSLTNPFPDTGDTASFDSASSNSLLDLGSGVTTSFKNFWTLGKASLFVAIMFACFQQSALRAANVVWSSTPTSNVWDLNSNWAGGTKPVANDVLFFDASNTTSLSNNFADNTRFNGLTFNSTASAYVFSGNRISLGGNIVNNSTNLQTIGFNISSASSQPRTFQMTAGGGDILFSGNLTSGGITTAGSGTLTLTGNNSAAANNFTVGPGTTLRISASNNLNLAGGTFNMQNATLDIRNDVGFSIGKDITLNRISPTFVFNVDRAVAGTGTNQTMAIGNLNLASNLSPSPFNMTVTGANGYGLTTGALNITGYSSAQTWNITNNAPGLLTMASLYSDHGASANTSSLVFSGTGNITIGAVTDTGAGSGKFGLTKNGSNRLTLSGENTYSESTIINAGTLQIGDGSSTGSLSSNSAITNNATLVFNRSGIVTQGTDFANSISGTGALTQNGSGTLILSGANAYTGATNVNSGTLSLAVITNGGVAGALGNSTNAAGNLVLGGGTLEYTGTSNGTTDRNFTLTAGTTSGISVANSTVSLTISGAAAATSGNLTKSGAGTLLLSGANAYTGSTTVSAGTLVLSGASGALGSGNVNVNSSAALELGNSGTPTVSNNISGSGTIRQIGSGVTTLSGSNTNSGAVEATAGTLLFSGADALSASTTSLNSSNSATLSFADGATRNSTIAGNMNLSGTSFLKFDINGASSDYLSTASGIASLSGTGKIQLNLLNAPTSTTTYNLLYAGGGISSTWTLDTTSFVSGSYTWNLSTSGNNTLQLTATAPTTNTYWKGATSGNWSTIANWAAGANGTDAGILPQAGYNVSFDSATPIGNLTTTLGGQDYTFSTLTISKPEVTINGSNTLNVTTSSSSAINIAATGNTTINANLAGAAGLTKSGTGTLALGGTNTYTGNTLITGGTVVVGSSTAFGSSAGIVELNPGGGNTITLQSGAASLALSNNFTLSSGTAAWDTNSNTTTISGAISGVGALTKTGLGNLTLAGQNTYTGATMISAGTLQIGAGSTIGSLSSSSAITNNGTLAFNRSNTITQGTDFASVISGTGNLIQAGTGNLTLTGNNTYSGTTTINAGTLEIALSGRLGGGTYSQNIANNGTLIYSGTNNQTLSGIISGTGALTQNNSSSTLTLSGNNTYTGTTRINAGVLNIQHNNALGTGANGTVVSSSGAALQLQNNITVAGEALTISGDGVSRSGALRSISGNNEWTGNITLAAGAGIQSDAGLLTISGNIITAGQQINFTGDGNITVSGVISGSGSTAIGTGFGSSSVLTLSGNNTFTSGITIRRGTVSVSSIKNFGVASGLGAAASGVIAIGYTSGNATLLYTGAGDTSNRTIQIGVNSNTPSTADTGSATIQNNGSGALVFNAAIFNAQTNASTGVGADRTLTLSGSNTGNNAISGVIQNNIVSGTGTGTARIGLIKNGVGTWILSGNNTYTGATTINAGTLQIGAGGASGALSTSSTITNNGTLVFNRSGTLTQGTDFASGISGTGNLTQAGSGNLIINAANTYTGVTTVANGTLTLSGSGTLGTSAITITGGTLDLGVSSITNTFSSITGGTLANGTLTNDGGNYALQNGTVSTNLAGTNGLTKSGAGTLTLTGSNTYSGATTLSAGNLSISSASALTNTSSVNLANATALIYTGGADNLTRDISVTGTTGSTGTIRNSGTGLLTLSGALSKNGTTLALQGGSGGITVEGVISGSANNSDLVIDGGSVTLAAANTYNGPTSIINSGTLNANTAGALPTSTLTAVTINGNSTLALGASQSVASLSGTSGSTVNLNANTLTINGSATTTYSGGISGTGNLVKNGSGTQTLAAANTYTGTTTVNSGTLQAAAAGATGNSTVINVTGGSFLVTAENAVNDSTAINLDGGRMALSGNFNENVGPLTLSKNSTIDFSSFVGTLRFSGISSWAPSANLAIWNWSGVPRYGDPVNNYLTPSNLVFTDNSLVASNLANISFYSGSGSGFIGNGFEVSGFEGNGSLIIAVPETETYLYAVALLAGVAVQYLRRRAKRKLLEGHRPA
jgi:autotransporter-associated beta strand protein